MRRMFEHIFLILITCVQKVPVLTGMCTAVSMDTGCWFGPLELLSPSKLRTEWGRGWVILGAEERRKENDCSRCGGQLKGKLPR